MTVRATALLLFLVSLLVAAAFWARGARDAATADATPATTRAHAAPSPVDPLPPPAAIVLPDTLPPKPADDLSIADALPTLQARADAGDSQAACRLGVELLRCSQRDGLVAQNAEAMARRERQLQALGKLDEADEIAARLLAGADLQRRCAGVSTEQTARAAHYVRQAALAGEPEALLRYAGGDTLAGSGTFGFIRTPEFETWRREARPLLDRALRAGQPAAVLAMVQVHSERSPLSMLVPRDPLEAEANLALARRLFGEIPAWAEEHASTTIDAEARANAQALAAERHARLFGGAHWNLAEAAALVAPLNAVHESPWPSARGADRVPCAPLPVGVTP